MSIGLLCLDCSASLADVPVEPPGRVRCACDLLYSCDLVEQADRDEWERVRLSRRFVRDGDMLIVSTT